MRYLLFAVLLAGCGPSWVRTQTVTLDPAEGTPDDIYNTGLRASARLGYQPLQVQAHTRTFEVNARVAGNRFHVQVEPNGAMRVWASGKGVRPTEMRRALADELRRFTREYNMTVRYYTRPARRAKPTAKPGQLVVGANVRVVLKSGRVLVGTLKGMNPQLYSVQIGDRTTGVWRHEVERVEVIGQ